MHTVSTKLNSSVGEESGKAGEGLGVCKWSLMCIKNQIILNKFNSLCTTVSRLQTLQ